MSLFNYEPRDRRDRAYELWILHNGEPVRQITSKPTTWSQITRLVKMGERNDAYAEDADGARVSLAVYEDQHGFGNRWDFSEVGRLLIA